MTKYQAGGPRRPYEITLLVVAVAAAGLNLRTAITSLPPLFPDLQTQLHLSSATLSLLAATPVICFGVVSAFTAWLKRRYGEEMILLVALILLTAGLLVRGVAPGVMLFPGTALAASAIAVLNVLLSSMAKRRWPERAGLLIGIYLTTLSVGAILSSLLSVPLYRSSGSMQLALGVWALPAALAALFWLPQLGYRTVGRATAAADGTVAPARAGVKVYRYALTWQVTAFMGLQSLLYYAALSWLPTIFQDRGDSAVTSGNLLALMGVGNLATSLLVPVLAHRRPSQRGLVVPSLIGTAAGLAGSVLGPGPRRQPGFVPRPGHLLHAGAGPQRGRGRVAVRLRPVGRLPGRQRRPAGGRAAAQRHRQLEPPGGPAARAVRRRTRHRPARGPPAPASLGHPAGCAGDPEYDTRVGDGMMTTSYPGLKLVHSIRLAFPPSGPYST
jgi:CP family cyanate transporter-like MFS transporter